jgi:hypothetical protein
LNSEVSKKIGILLNGDVIEIVSSLKKGKSPLEIDSFYFLEANFIDSVVESLKECWEDCSLSKNNFHAKIIVAK